MRGKDFTMGLILFGVYCPGENMRWERNGSVNVRVTSCFEVASIALFVSEKHTR